jgi:hypothetical protein
MHVQIRSAELAGVGAANSILRSVNLILDGTLPRLSEVLDSSLTAGGLRPIAIREVWPWFAGSFAEPQPQGYQGGQFRPCMSWLRGAPRTRQPS